MDGARKKFCEDGRNVSIVFSVKIMAVVAVPSGMIFASRADVLVGSLGITVAAASCTLHASFIFQA